MSKNVMASVAVGLFMVIGLSTAGASLLTMTADGMARGGWGAENSYHIIFCGNNSNGSAVWQDKAIFKFSMTGVTNEVATARMYVYINNKQYSPADVDVARVAVGDSSQVTIGDYSAAILTTPVQAFPASTGMNQWVDFDVKDILELARGDTAEYLAIQLMPQSMSGDLHGDVFGFAESSVDPDLAAHLEYTLVPEPATLALFGLGLAGFRRRR